MGGHTLSTIWAIPEQSHSQKAKDFSFFSPKTRRQKIFSCESFWAPSLTTLLIELSKIYKDVTVTLRENYRHDLQIQWARNLITIERQKEIEAYEIWVLDGKNAEVWSLSGAVVRQEFHYRQTKLLSNLLKNCDELFSSGKQVLRVTTTWTPLVLEKTFVLKFASPKTLIACSWNHFLNTMTKATKCERRQVVPIEPLFLSLNTRRLLCLVVHGLKKVEKLFHQIQLKTFFFCKNGPFL